MDPARPIRSRRWLRLLLAFCLAGGLGYVGIALFMLWNENRFVFQALPATAFWQKPQGPDVQDLMIPTGDGTRVHAWWCPVEGSAGAVLYCHGNGGNVSCYGPQAETIRKQLGESVLLFDYPGYGKSEGSATEAGCYAAADAAYDWLTHSAGVRPEQVTIYGCSLGGGVAVELAARRPCRALLLASTFTSLPDVGQGVYPWLPVRWVARNRFDSLARIGSYRGPLVITHGTADGLIPFPQSEALFEAANEPKLFLPMEGANHIEASPEFFRRCRQFLESGT